MAGMPGEGGALICGDGLRGERRPGGSALPTSGRVGAGRREGRLAVRLAVGAGLATLASLPFLGLLLLVDAGFGPAKTADRRVADLLNAWALDRPAAVAVLEVLGVVTGPWTFRLLVLVAAALLWRAGSRRRAVWALTTMAVGGLLGALCKEVVQRARPTFPEPVAFAPHSSFPSVHALNSMLGTAVLLLIVLPALPRRGRAAVRVAAAIAVLVTAFDRVALGVHFLTDVLAGWALAGAVAIGTTTAFAVWRGGHPPTPPGAAPPGIRRVGIRRVGTRWGPGRGGAGRQRPATWPGELAVLLGRAAPSVLGTLALMVAMGLLLTRVVADDWPVTAVDRVVAELAAARTPLWDRVTNGLSRVADTWTVVAATVTVGLLFRLRFGRWRDSAFLASAVSVQALVFLATAFVVSRPRPAVVQLDPAPPTSSFPSGHTGAAVALYLGIAVVLAWHARRPRGRALVVAALLLVPVAVAYSRLYRGMHHPFDVVGSFVNGGLSVLIAARVVLLGPLPRRLGALLDADRRPAPGVGTAGSRRPGAGRQ